MTGFIKLKVTQTSINLLNFKVKDTGVGIK